MIWLAFIAIFFVMAFKDIMVDDPLGRSFLDICMSLLLVFLLTIGAAIFCAGGAALVGLAFDTHAAETGTYKLIALRDKDGIEGHFFLGTGEVKGDTYYFYYTQLADGGFRPGKVYAGRGVRVYEEERKDATLTEYTWVLNNSWAWLVAIPVNEGGYAADFHVPKGTIRRGYTM